MRIALISETFLPSTDGIVTRLCATIKWLLENGHEVLIIAPDPGMDEFNGARVKAVPAHSFFFYPEKKLSLPSRLVRRHLVEFQPDVVHVVNPALVGVAGVYYARRLRMPLIASYHTNVPQYLSFYSLAFLEPAMWWYIRTLHNRAQLNLCTSQAVRTELIAKGFRNVHVWKRGVDVERFGPRHYDRSMRARLTNNCPEKTLLLYVGRLASEKEIEKIRDVLAASPDFCFALVGDGPYRPALERFFAGTNTVFAGFLHGQDLAMAYASADIFIFPSTTETLGLVILEAMASGLPIVAAKSGPTCEQILDGVTGMLYEPGNPQSFRETVFQLQNPTVRQGIADNALAASRKFGWDEPSKQLLEFYHMVVGN